MNVLPNISTVISLISLAVSLSVLWLTLLRQGKLRMTRPVQIAFVFETGKPKVFLRTLLYSTGKRGYVIEGLYLIVRRGDAKRTFGFWGYGERNELMAGGGLRIGEEGAAYNHHFLETSEEADFQFLEGEYEIEVYARVVNRRSPQKLSQLCLSLPPAYAKALIDGFGVLFTWDPDAIGYLPVISDRYPHLQSQETFQS